MTGIAIYSHALLYKIRTYVKRSWFYWFLLLETKKQRKYIVIYRAVRHHDKTWNVQRSGAIQY